MDRWVSVARLGWCASLVLGIGCGDEASTTTSVWDQPETQYVVSRLDLPFTAADSRRLGFDLDGDQNVDNLLGETLTNAGSLFPANAQDEIDAVVAAGGVIHLFSLYARTLTDSPEAMLWELRGPATPLPSGMSAGMSFAVDAAGPDGMYLAGAVTAGDAAFASDTGTMSLTLPLTSTATATFTVRLPRVELTVGADGALEGRIGGAVPESEVVSELTRAFDDQLARTCLARTSGGLPPGQCGCEGPGAETIRTNLDTNGDCVITADEIRNHPVVALLIKGDVTLVDGSKAISLGVGFRAIPAQFTHPSPAE